MTKTPLILLPGLLCDEALWAHQSETLSDIADITVADMTRDETIQGMAERMLEKGVYVIGFSFPVVPQGQARIRVQMSAAHSPEDIDRCIAAFAEAGREMGVIA